MSLLNLLCENATLDKLRDEIDKTDEELMEKLRERLDIVQKIGEFKKEYGIKTVQQGRWEEVLDNLKKFSSKHDLDYDLIVEIWNDIHKLSVDMQNKIKQHKKAI